MRPSVDLLRKIPACIWAPWRFVLHEHLPPSHMASIKPCVIILVQKSVRRTVLNSSDLQHTHTRHHPIRNLPPTTHVPWYLPPKAAIKSSLSLVWNQILAICSQLFTLLKVLSNKVLPNYRSCVFICDGMRKLFFFFLLHTRFCFLPGI